MSEIAFWQKCVRQGQRIVGLLGRPMTLGVRAIALDDADRVFLVRHAYIPGFHLPGGGVESGETAMISLLRELREEGGLETLAPPSLFGFYYNPRHSRRDHVALYLARVRQDVPRTPGLGNRRIRFFSARRPSRRRHGLDQGADRRIFTQGGAYAFMVRALRWRRSGK